MSLFGRRKPGFAREVELRPEDITDEFSDRNDPAMLRNSNPKEEKAELAARAQAVMEGAACQESMANNYAMIATLVLEKDIARTVAHMVRFNCKTYPSPTPLYHFMRSPYSYTKPQLEQALRVLKAGKDTQDIQTVVAFNDVLYMYSTDIMSERYAKALSDGNEAGEADF